MGGSSALLERYAEQPFLLAPMAGVTDAAYRVMCREHGARLAYTEMVSVAGLVYGSDKTWELVYPADEEPDIAVQLFGAKPEQFAFAVDAVGERLGDRLALIDINMACPARKVVTKGEGCALMRDPELAERIVRATVAHSRVPVTVKTRIGYAAGERVAPEFAARMEEAGAAAVAVHGRYATQLYHGEADWSIIGDVASRVSVPVVGSGDVLSARDAVRMLSETPASAVFVARGSYGNPWIFEDARTLASGGEPPEHDAFERIAAFRRHLELLAAHGSHMVRARTFAAWYLKGLPGASAWRSRAVSCTTAEDFERLVDDLEREASARSGLA